MDFTGKSIVITGSGAGIGRRAAVEMASRGGLVTVCDIDEEKAEAVVGEIGNAGGSARAARVDVTSYNDVKAMIDGAVSAFGKVDILINNAGAGTMKFFTETTPEDWRFDIDLCLYGVMNSCHAALPGMIEAKSGRIVNVCSDAGRVGEPRLTAYSAAKAGVIGFTKALAREVARSNVLVNCVCFSTVKTETTQAMFDDAPDMEQKMVKRYPMKRVGTMDEAANTLMLMASEYVTFITGQVLSMNGGYAMVS